MPANLDGIVWLILTLAPLLILQRSLHRELQVVFLLTTRREDIAITLFSILLFPGVLLHEGSHYLMARMVGVRTGRFSLFPRPLPGGKLQLGFVETASADWLRETMIGMAPLLSGLLFVAYAGLLQMNLSAIGQVFRSGDLQLLAQMLRSLIQKPDFWLWFYLALVVSSTMLPSAADRRAWLPLFVFFALLLGISLVLGAGPWLYDTLAAPFNQVLRVVAFLFGISVLLHGLMLPFAWLLRRLLSRLTGLEVML